MRGLRFALIAFCAIATWARAQTDAAARQQIEESIGQRVEAFAVLSTQRAIQTGGYNFRIHDADGSVNRVSFVIDLGEKRRIGNTGLYWQPVIDAGIGASRFVNHFTEGELAGNDSIYDTLAISGLIGPRVYLTSGLSIFPSIGVLQAYTENDFRAHTPDGMRFESEEDGRAVNWDVVTLTHIPSIEARYEKTIGALKLDLRTGYARYATRPLYRSTDKLSFVSESASWNLRADVDYATGVELWHFPLRIGATAARTQLLDGLQQSLNTNHYYRTGPRIMFDIPGKLWVLGAFGVGYTWVWGDGFSGYNIGLELEFSL